MSKQKVVTKKPTREMARPNTLPDQPDIQVWAVIIGVAAYDHMPALRYTDDDAYRMYAFFKSPEGGALDDDPERRNHADAQNGCQPQRTQEKSVALQMTCERVERRGEAERHVMAGRFVAGIGYSAFRL